LASPSFGIPRNGIPRKMPTSASRARVCGAL
jgi:hypothetical protein